MPRALQTCDQVERRNLGLQAAAEYHLSRNVHQAFPPDLEEPYQTNLRYLAATKI
jgi:hypothetical protein